VSVLHVMKGPFPGTKRLEDREVETITAFLFHRGGHDDPARLLANAAKSFVGSYILGMGFTFDDADRKGVATPLAEMQRLIEKDPRNAERIFPYVGGEEINTNPTQGHDRYVINFGEMSETEARRWPELMAIVERKVKPDRETKAKDVAAWPWWQFWRRRQELYDAIAGLKRVLVISRVTEHPGFVFLPAGRVFSERLVVFPLAGFAALSVLQSRVHEVWARFFSATLADTLMYAPSDCFETFPFPENWQTRPALEAAGEIYDEYRAALMVRNGEGLTKTYNRFHDPHERDPEIARLRELHAAMDRAVLDAYGWTDIPIDCEPLLDYEIDEEGWGDKKKPFHYRWPDEVRDEVLARLLDLNAQRDKEEERTGTAAVKKRGERSAMKPAANPPSTGRLFS
jgi:hypothetical protein